MGGQKTHVACVWTGTKYPIEYVHKLYRAAYRHMPGFRGRDWEFNVLTDDSAPFACDPYRVVFLTEPLQGYWNKLWLFLDNFPAGDRVLYFDLDVLICNSLEALVRVKYEPLVMMWDPIRPARWNSSVMSWTAGDPRVRQVMLRWFAEGRPTKPAVKHSKGDQAWIEYVMRDQMANREKPPEMWQDLAPNVVKPYYHKGKNGEYSTPTKHTENFNWYGLDRATPASVIVFHGAPRFHELDLPMVKEHWR